MKKWKWIVIYKGGSGYRITYALTKKHAKNLFKIFDDAVYLVKIKRVKEPKDGR